MYKLLVKITLILAIFSIGINMVNIVTWHQVLMNAGLACVQIMLVAALFPVWLPSELYLPERVRQFRRKVMHFVLINVLINVLMSIVLLVGAICL